jgi:hypothetical protein
VVSTVLVTKHEEEGQAYPIQKPVYYVREVLADAKTCYSQPQKFLYSILGCLWHSFGSHFSQRCAKREHKTASSTNRFAASRDSRSLERFGRGEAAKGQLHLLRPTPCQACPRQGPRGGGGRRWPGTRRRTWGVTTVVVHRRRSSKVQHGAAGRISTGRRRRTSAQAAGELGGGDGRHSWQGQAPVRRIGGRRIP